MLNSWQGHYIGDSNKVMNFYALLVLFYFFKIVILFNVYNELILINLLLFSYFNKYVC